MDFKEISLCTGTTKEDSYCRTIAAVLVVVDFLAWRDAQDIHEHDESTTFPTHTHTPGE